MFNFTYGFVTGSKRDSGVTSDCVSSGHGIDDSFQAYGVPGLATAVGALGAPLDDDDDDVDDNGNEDVAFDKYDQDLHDNRCVRFVRLPRSDVHVRVFAFLHQ